MPLLNLPNGISLSYFSFPDSVPSPSRPTLLFMPALLQRAEIQFEPQIRDAQLAGFNLVGIDVHGHGDTVGRDSWDYADNATDVVAGMVSLWVLAVD
jgi:pimeloyl-ACP methyl ester carboxylesterase